MQNNQSKFKITTKSNPHTHPQKWLLLIIIFYKYSAVISAAAAAAAACGCEKFANVFSIFSIYIQEDNPLLQKSLFELIDNMKYLEFYQYVYDCGWWTSVSVINIYTLYFF